MGKTIALAQHKGGTAKTTTCINLGASLCTLGKSVLLIDLDPQSSLTLSLGIDPLRLERSIHHVLVDPDQEIEPSLLRQPAPGLSVLPAHIDLAMAEMELAGKIGREKALQRKLARAREGFDYILIDCPPTLGILTVNALAASQSVLIPMQCEPLTLYGVKHLLQVIRLVTEELNPTLKIEGVVRTMYDSRTRLSREVCQSIQETFGDLAFETIIHKRIKLAEGPVHETPICMYAPGSPADQEYRQLAAELLAREARQG